MKKILLLIAMLPSMAWAQETLPASASASTPASQPADTRETMRLLWLENVQAPETPEPTNLNKAISDLLAIELGPHNKPKLKASVATPASVPASLPAAQPLVKKPLSAELAAKLQALATGQGELASIADDLYQAQEFEGAATLYDLALKNDKDADAGWLLLQLANCNSKTDPAKAIALYKRVIVEHASSPWARVASAQALWLEWSRAMPADAQAAAESRQPATQISQGNNN